MSKKSNEFDEKEKKLEEGPMEFIKQFLPLVKIFTNKPTLIKISMELKPYQLIDLGNLAEKWAMDCPDMIAYGESEHEHE